MSADQESMRGQEGKEAEERVEMTWERWEENIHKFDGALAAVGLEFPTKDNRTLTLVAKGSLTKERVLQMGMRIRKRQL